MSKDEWETPRDLFDILDKGGTYQGITFEGFNFDIDLCANSYNHKCRLWFKDYLNNYFSDISIDINGKTCFLNPPYSNPKPFIEKAWEDSKYCKIVCLVKVDPSTKWWATFWNYDDTYRICPECKTVQLGANKDCSYYNRCIKAKLTSYNGPKPGCKVIFFTKRIKFHHPERTGSGPSFPSCLVIMDRRNLNE